MQLAAQNIKMLNAAFHDPEKTPIILHKLSVVYSLKWLFIFFLKMMWFDIKNILNNSFT